MLGGNVCLQAGPGLSRFYQPKKEFNAENAQNIADHKVAGYLSEVKEGDPGNDNGSSLMNRGSLSQGGPREDNLNFEEVSEEGNSKKGQQVATQIDELIKKNEEIVTQIQKENSKFFSRIKIFQILSSVKKMLIVFQNEHRQEEASNIHGATIHVLQQIQEIALCFHQQKKIQAYDGVDVSEVLTRLLDLLKEFPQEMIEHTEIQSQLNDLHTYVTTDLTADAQMMQKAIIRLSEYKKDQLLEYLPFQIREMRNELESAEKGLKYPPGLAKLFVPSLLQTKIDDCQKAIQILEPSTSASTAVASNAPERNKKIYEALRQKVRLMNEQLKNTSTTRRLEKIDISQKIIEAFENDNEVLATQLKKFLEPLGWDRGLTKEEFSFLLKTLEQYHQYDQVVKLREHELKEYQKVIDSDSGEDLTMKWLKNLNNSDSTIKKDFYSMRFAIDRIKPSCQTTLDLFTDVSTIADLCNHLQKIKNNDEVVKKWMPIIAAPLSENYINELKTLKEEFIDAERIEGGDTDDEEDEN